MIECIDGGAVWVGQLILEAEELAIAPTVAGQENCGQPGRFKPNLVNRGNPNPKGPWLAAGPLV